VADPGRRVGCGPGRPHVPLGDQAGQAGVGSARRGRRRGGHTCRRPHAVAAPDAWLASSAGARPRWVVVAEPDARVGGPGGVTEVPAGMGARPQRGPSRQRARPARCRQRCDLRRWLVGLPGLEPGTSSLSAIKGSALCGPAFPQVTAERQGRSNAFLPTSPTSTRNHFRGRGKARGPIRRWQGDGAAGWARQPHQAA
jgi:hypothetical protein